MQFYANKDRLPLKSILFFALVVFIAYLPVSTFLFFLKNDAFTGYFPPKFFMSESIHAGHLPLWNPYINFGIPQYGDMSSGYWSPVTWLIASTVGYNAYTFTLEVLLYILIGGIGMYQLLISRQLNKQVCIISAVAFMCCGYNVGHLQHFNWLSGAAFLPWCFWSYDLMLKDASLKNLVRAALLFYLLVASAHPGITISAFYFFSAYFVFYVVQSPQKKAIGERIKRYSSSHLIFIALFLVLGAGLICGYLDILPHFVRSEKIGLADSLLQPTTLQSWGSILFPFATVKNDAFFNTDPSMRNSYFSVTLLLFLLLSLFSKKTKLQTFLLFAGLFFGLLSSGGIFKTIAYKFIPFVGYVRLNGEFSIFTLLCIIIIAAIELDKFIKLQKGFTGLIKWVYYLLEAIVMIAIVTGLYKAINSKESIVYHIGNISLQEGIAAKLKVLIDGISFYDTIWIQGFVQLLLLWGVKWCIKFSNWALLKKIVVVDMVVACLFNIPFTGVGKASVAQVQQALNKSPRGIPVPQLIPLKNYDSASTDEKLMVGDWSFYNKRPGVVREAAYPIVLKNMATYFGQDSVSAKSIYIDRPFVFTKDSFDNTISIAAFAPQQIDIQVSSEQSTTLVLQQNFYPHWYYTNGKERKAVNEYGINFMSAPISKGATNVRFIFDPVIVKWGMLISFVALLFFCLFLIFPRKETKGN